MNTYLLLKHLHISLAAISISLFIWRGIFMWRNQPLPSKLQRILPHIVDTLLLAAGVSLAVLARLNPQASPWLLVKLLAVLAYIILGIFALKRGRTLAQRRCYFVLAVTVFAYIAAVAVSKSPWIIQ